MNEILSRLDAQACVLDLGCGHGSFAHENYVARVIGMDQYIADLATFQRRIATGRIHYLMGNGEQIPLASGSVDLVVCNHIFEHVYAPQHVAAEIARVLKPTGFLFATIPDGHSFSDALYRWWAKGGGHVQRYTFRGFQQTVESGTNLQLLHAHRLFSSFLYLNPPQASFRYLPWRAKMLHLLSEGGRRKVLNGLNATTRLLDSWLATRSSLYGWACYFGKPGAQLPDLNREEFINVCAKCGCGHSAGWLEAVNRVGRSYGRPAYLCDCGFPNFFYGKWYSRKILQRGSRPVEADSPPVTWVYPLAESSTDDRRPEIPLIDPEGVVNAAAHNAELAPGSLVKVFGSNFADHEQAWSGEGLHWPWELARVQLLVNGRVTPLKYVSPSQIVAHLPQDLPRGATSFQVRREELLSSMHYVYLTLTAPSLFGIEAGIGNGKRAVLRATGLGPVVPPLPGGQLCPAEVPFRPTRAVTAWVDERPTEVSDCVLVPGDVGVFEITIPIKRALNGQKICVEVGGRRSNTLQL